MHFRLHLTCVTAVRSSQKVQVLRNVKQAVQFWPYASLAKDFGKKNKGSVQRSHVALDSGSERRVTKLPQPHCLQQVKQYTLNQLHASTSYAGDELVAGQGRSHTAKRPTAKHTYDGAVFRQQVIATPNHRW